MKRFFFTVIALAAVAVGCTKSGLIESPQTYEIPITFEPYTGKAPVTKAAVVATADLYADGFRVIGFEQAAKSDALTGDQELFSNTSAFLDRKVVAKYNGGNLVTDTDGKTVWTYENAMYWPENKYLAFVAYGLNVNSDGSDPDTTVGLDESTCFVRGADYTTFTYTVSKTVADQKDLVISPLMKDKNNASGKIAVQLHHVLSRVGFKVLPSGTSGVNVVIKNINLTGNFVESGTFDLTTAVDVSTTPKSYDVELGSAAATAFSYSLFGDGYAFGATAKASYKGFSTTSTTGTQTAVPVWNNYAFASGNTFNPKQILTADLKAETDAAYSNRYMMLMPQEITGATVEVIYHLSDDIERVATIPIGDAAGKFEFEAGKAYEFVFTISTTAVGFDIVVNPWNPAAGQDVDSTLTPVA
ncbi:MAG: hypothetical protein J6S01_06620 [Bacteroidales bacterium]|nr:hypothetical protein [Bacteroidales bacterium]